MPSYLVIGGSSGIGAALAARLLRQPESRVLIAARDTVRLEETAQSLGCEWAACDARSFEQVEQLFRERGPFEGAACCAGSIVIKPAHLTREQELLECYEQNLKTAFATVAAAGKHMPDGGAVVLFSSCAARIGLPNHEAISAMKAGVEALATSAAATYSARRLRFNSIAPGLVDTPLAQRFTSRPAARQASEAMHPLGRLGSADEVASLAAWLLGPEASWVTGQVFGQDGGLSRLKPAK